MAGAFSLLDLVGGGGSSGGGIMPPAQQTTILSPAQRGRDTSLVRQLAQQFGADPEALGALRAGIMAGVKIDPGALVQRLKDHGLISQLHDSEVQELEKRLVKWRAGGDLMGAALSPLYLGKGGLIDVPLGKGVVSGVGGTVTWTLASLGGGGELFDCRLYLQDEKEVAAYIATVTLGSKDLWSVSAQVGAATSQSPFVCSTGRIRNTHPDFRPGDGFRLGRLNVSNNNQLKIVAQGASTLAAADEVWGWIAARPVGGDIGAGTACLL